MPNANLSRLLSNRISSAAALMVGILLVLVALCAVGLLGWHEYQETLRDDSARGELQARVLEDHATRSFETVSVALTYLSKDLVRADILGGSVRADALLSQALVGLPFVREIGVLDASGYVMASSLAADTGVRVEMARLGVLPVPGQDKIGRFEPGRSLAAWAAGAAPAQAKVGFIPVTRVFTTRAGQNIQLVALVNPDFFANFQLFTLNNDQNSAYLLGFQGNLLASSGPAAGAPGSNMAQHPVFRSYLPAKEHASYVGTGAVQDAQVVAFRLSKSRPLVVLVEQPYANSVWRWFLSMRWFAAAGLAMAALLVCMTVAVRRGLRARVAVDAQLSAARLDLVHREHELRVLLKSVQELIFRTDRMGAITFINDRWTALRGQSLEQTVHHTLVQLVEVADRDAVARLFALPGDAAVRLATAHLRSGDGHLRRFDFTVVPLRDNEEIVGFAGSAVDVTQRFAAEQALQHQLGFAASLLEISPTPVATINARGNYTSVNRAWEEFMGLRREQVIGKPGIAFMEVADADLHAKGDAQLWRTGGTLRYELKLHHGDGSRRDVVVTKVLLPGAELGASLLSSMLDVSEFRMAERAKDEARVAAEESSRAKSEFIANISHELRTPLQSILGFSELGMVRGRESPKLQGMFSDIHASGGRMLALVNDLLDVAKIESSVGAITLERADLRGLVQGVLHELSPLLDGKHIQLLCQLGRQPLIAKVDPTRFQQVVRNIVANAIKVSPPGAELAVEAHLTDDRRICLRVRDHGTGVPTAELEKIFEAFVQSSTSKDGSGGTGLGLAICKKIIDAHSGSIVANNMPDGGAVFSIYLPARQNLHAETMF
ncbi:ATP-binding protein [Rhodoferax sp. WC2427]|uniref:ATP-binding protein n=1 Tax=Rhodoferax sp. WC2427 TaxID=3234144 RepID=UPI0034668223